MRRFVDIDVVVVVGYLLICCTLLVGCLVASTSAHSTCYCSLLRNAFRMFGQWTHVFSPGILSRTRQIKRKDNDKTRVYKGPSFTQTFSSHDREGCELSWSTRPAGGKEEKKRFIECSSARGSSNSLVHQKSHSNQKGGGGKFITYIVVEKEKQKWHSRGISSNWKSTPTCGGIADVWK